MFEAHNHSLVKMFNGIQYVPQQIVHTFLLKKVVQSLSRQCIPESSSVKCLLQKLNKSTKFVHVNVSEGFTTLGLEKHIEVGAREVLAVQHLLGINVVNRHALFYERFLQNYQMYSSVKYTRAKRHTNFSISYEDNSVTAYGTILGLLKTRPLCQCNAEEYCHCAVYNIVLVQPMLVNSRFVYKDAELGVSSHFILEVSDVDRVKAVMPSQISRKCVLMIVNDRKYVCPLPYRIYGD